MNLIESNSRVTFAFSGEHSLSILHAEGENYFDIIWNIKKLEILLETDFTSTRAKREFCH